MFALEILGWLEPSGLVGSQTGLSPHQRLPRNQPWGPGCRNSPSMVFYDTRLVPNVLQIGPLGTRHGCLTDTLQQTDPGTHPRI